MLEPRHAHCSSSLCMASRTIELGWVAAGTLVALAGLEMPSRISRHLPSPSHAQDGAPPELDALSLAPLLGLGTAADREVDSTSEVWGSPPMQRRGAPGGAHFVPVFREGQAFGFALVRIQPRSAYAKLGLREGDIVRRIDGLELTSPERVLGAWEHFRSAAPVVLDIERGGRMIRKTYLPRSGRSPTPSPPPP